MIFTLPAIVVLQLLLLLCFLLVASAFPLALTRHWLTERWRGLFDLEWMGAGDRGQAGRVGAWLFMSHLLGKFALALDEG